MLVKDLFKRRVSLTREKIFTASAFLATTFIFLLLLITVETGESGWKGRDIFAWLFLAYIFVGQMLYFVTRYGYFHRLRSHRPATDEELQTFFSEEAPSLVFLVPSYKEEISVIRQTLLSAALQDYPSRRVVLLIDDPATPKTQQDRQQLEQARALTGEIEASLATQSHCYANEWMQYSYRKQQKQLSLEEECRHLAKLHERVVQWFVKQAETTCVNTHVDSAFIALTYSERIDKHRRRVAEAERGEWNNERVEQEYRHLATLFATSLTSFERKRYHNMSHASNKAMNLNSYISLMGKSWGEVVVGDNRLLEETVAEGADFTVPNDEYVAVIDASSNDENNRNV